jgi:hypothetical protein
MVAFVFCTLFKKKAIKHVKILHLSSICGCRFILQAVITNSLTPKQTQKNAPQIMEALREHNSQLQSHDNQDPPVAVVFFSLMNFHFCNLKNMILTHTKKFCEKMS